MGKAPVRGIVLDSGPIIALERRGYVDAIVRRVVALSVMVVVPAAVVAEVWRGGPKAAATARLLKSAHVAPLDERLARAAGELLARSGSDATIDAIVVTTARWFGYPVLTFDAKDMTPLARIARVHLEVLG